MAESLHRAYLGLGGNLGDPQAAMREALALLDAHDGVSVVGVSSLYSTPPWGKLDQPDFLNAVAGVDTTLSARQLLDLCLDTERQLKRVRVERWGPRAIDMDILWFDGLAVAEPGLEVPHPRMSDRAFVMVPLAEIAPDLAINEQTASAIAAGLDQGGISIAAKGSAWALG